ncbi:Probable flavin-containing monoamine oxidase A [Durusdinium trenchii]|uniref:Amine oxidase n=1 Tax=Durusdinium trenchii TaxID=1381693 RepID=A0ABP0HRX2_9DINO
MCDADVIVVGAGISGLACARELLRKGIHVCVLEASDRVGGRTYSVEMSSQRIDLGGQWIASKAQQPFVQALVKELGLQLHPQHYNGKRILDLQDRQPLEYSTDIPTGIGLRALLAVQFTLWYCTLQARLNIGSAAAKDTSGKLGRFDQHSTADVLEKIAGLSGQVATKALVTAMIRGVFGCEAKELSWLHFLHYIACAGGLERLVTIKKGFQEHTVLGGAQQISERLAKEVRSLGGKLEFNCKVTSVTTEADGVWVACGESKSFRCLRCVFATPPKQLGNVKFAPALPSSRAALHTSVFIGCIIKAVFRYGRPFWRLNGFSGEVVAEATDDEPCFNCYDHCVGDCHMLVCFLNGSPARTWSLRTQDERRQVLLKQLTKWFGPEASHPLEYLEKDWAADEFTGGCPVGGTQGCCWFFRLLPTEDSCTPYAGVAEALW